MKSSLHSSANQSLNIINGLKYNIIYLCLMLEESNRGKEEKDKEEIRFTDEDDYLHDESPSKRKRSKKRKR